jgi:hypothetical protein
MQEKKSSYQKQKEKIAEMETTIFKLKSQLSTLVFSPKSNEASKIKFSVHVRTCNEEAWWAGDYKIKNLVSEEAGLMAGGIFNKLAESDKTNLPQEEKIRNIAEEGFISYVDDGGLEVARSGDGSYEIYKAQRMADKLIELEKENKKTIVEWLFSILSYFRKNKK